MDPNNSAIRGCGVLSGKAIRLTMVCLPFEKESVIKEDNGKKSFLLEYTPFQKWLGVQKHQQDVKKVVSLKRIGVNLTKCI